MTPRQITHSVPPLWESVEYPSISPWSATNKYLLTIAVDHVRIRDGTTGELLHDLTTIGASSEPRWRKINPGQFLYRDGNRLMAWDSASGIEVVHEFAEYESISFGEESDLSEDGNHLAVVGTRASGLLEIFQYEISTGAQSTPYVSLAFDALKISPENHILISRPDGIFVVDWNMKQLTTTNGHAACTRDANGDEVLIYTSNLDNGIWKVPIAAPQERKLLLTLDWSQAVDISAQNGVVLVSSYGNPPVTGKYANQIFRLPLDGSEPEVLCDHGSVMIPKPEGGIYYTPQPRAALSRDGSRFAFASNSGHAEIPEYCETWLGIIDENYSEIIKGAETKRLKEVDFTADEGREWQWHFRVVNGKMTVRVFDVI